MRISLVALFAIAMGLFSSGNANAAVLCSSADGRGVEVGNIWCNTERNYQNSRTTKCFAAQYNAPMNVRLYVRVGYSQFGQEFRPMPPGIVYLVFSWRDYTRPAPQCVLDWPPGSTRLRYHKR
jgi:hypothetical protein